MLYILNHAVHQLFSRGTVELHVCSAECAQDVGAILGFGKKRPTWLFVQGNNADEWKEATPLQQQQYQIARGVPQEHGSDWASLATWMDPKTKQRWAITRVNNNYYMYLSDTHTRTITSWWSFGRTVVLVTKQR